MPITITFIGESERVLRLLVEQSGHTIATTLGQLISNEASHLGFEFRTVPTEECDYFSIIETAVRTQEVLDEQGH